MNTVKNTFYCSNISSDIYMDDDGDFKDKRNAYGYIYPWLFFQIAHPSRLIMQFLCD